MGVWLYYLILMMTKMSRTEISAKILKRQSFYYQNHTKSFSAHDQGKVFPFKPNMKQIDEAVQALACAIGLWQPSWILFKKLNNAKKKITRQIPQSQYAYCKYLEIIRVGVLEWEQEQVAPAVAGGLGKINKSPPPHSGWRLNESSYWYVIFQSDKESTGILCSCNSAYTYPWRGVILMIVTSREATASVW